jgi:hypothetical protein
MRVKRLMTTRMAGKKSATKMKGKIPSPPPQRAMGGEQVRVLRLTSKCWQMSASLHLKEIIQWRPAISDKRPFEKAEEIVLFRYFVERGLALPTFDFFHGLLFYYGIQLHHLNPNSILPIAIFVDLYGAFLEIEPYFDLFCYPFHLNPQPNEDTMYEVGGAGIQLRQGMEKKYIPYKLLTSLSGWREWWFYIGNHESSLPERTAGALKIAGEWTIACRDMSQIEDLFGMIKVHRDAGVTGVSVMYSWLGRWIQPLQKCTRFGFEYLGLIVAVDCPPPCCLASGTSR